MRKIIAFISLLLVIYSCSKPAKTTPPPIITDTSHLHKDTAVFSPDSASVLGKWYSWTTYDSLFNPDGTFYTTDTLIRDTTVSGFKDCNYVDFGSIGYFLSGVCFSSAPSPSITYYAYVSPHSFSETYGNMLTGQHDSKPFDTAIVKNISPLRLTLYREVTISKSPGVDYRHHVTDILTK